MLNNSKLTLIFLFVSVYLFLYTLDIYRNIGFPDGYVSEYFSALRIPLLVYMLFDVMAFGYFVFKNRRHDSFYECLKVFILYVLFRFIFINLVDWYLLYVLDLDNGRGG